MHAPHPSAAAWLRGILWVAACWSASPASALGEVSLGGFIPLVGIGLTDEFKNASTDLTGTFFIADREDALVGSPLVGSQGLFYEIALLDTGAATHILTAAAAGPAGFAIKANGFDGTNSQQIGGATGLLSLAINDPLALFAAGLGDRLPSAGKLALDPAALRGQSSVATLTAPAAWQLPSILGLPMAAQHAIAIRNDQPQVFAYGGETVRTPQVDFLPLGSGKQQGIARRTDLRIRPGASFIAGPLYVQNLDILGGNFEFHENPLSPTVIENGGLFLEVDLANGAPLWAGSPYREHMLQDVELLFDTGADLTVVSQLTAKRLGFDAVLDRPDFVLEVEGSGGVQAGVPGFYLAELRIDAVGGSFTAYDVPLAVLDVTNPNDPGNTIDGILGMHLFNDRNLVIDATASIGQGGAGPSLYVSDPVTEPHAWAATGSVAGWNDATSWNAAGTPGPLWVVDVRNAPGAGQTAVLSAGQKSLVFDAHVAGSGGKTMDLRVEAGAELIVYGETTLADGGRLTLAGGRLDARLVSLEGGVLHGNGVVYAGSGPISGVVRNLSGVIDPGAASGGVGALQIAGDLSLLEEATLVFDLAGTAPALHDRLAVDRYAFLSGALVVQLAAANGAPFAPQVGDAFTLLSAAKGVQGVFDALLLPTGYRWQIDYQPSSVILRVAGLGALAGDFNGDGAVNDADFRAWESGFGAPPGVHGRDLLAWQRARSSGAAATAVPEPTAGGLFLCGLFAAAAALRRPR
jgi:hypothetical protein